MVSQTVRYHRPPQAFSYQGVRFTRQYGVSPHAYVVGRRVEAARHLLLRGARPADVAVAVGFYDQAHFTRHFRRHVGTTPARYARGG